MNYQDEVVKNAAKFGCASKTNASDIIRANVTWMILMGRAAHRRNNETPLPYLEWWNSEVKTGNVTKFVGYMSNRYSFIEGEFAFPDSDLELISEQLLLELN